MRANLGMDIVWCQGADALAKAAANEIAGTLKTNPAAALLLPTGHTPLGMYREIVARVRAGTMDLKAARFFNLDEYVGLPPTHPLSYARFLQEHLFDPAGVDARQVRLLKGDAADLWAESAAYESAIGEAGGAELAVLGLGVNGHVAFNEPGARWDTDTGVVELSPKTREVHRLQTGGAYAIPVYGLSVGIATIRRARRVLLLVAGDKHEALGAWLRGVEDPAWPVTSLLNHPGLKVLGDAALKNTSLTTNIPS